MDRLTSLKKAIWIIGAFLALYFLFCLRSIYDFGTSYLWCEDGMILYADAAKYGIESIFYESNGSMWFIQRLLGWIVYSVTYSLNVLKLYPVIMSLITKFIEVACVFYFTSEKFSWIIESKWMRLFVSASVLVAIPDTGVDVVNCDTSAAFIYMFAVFLIGLNAFWPVEKLSVFEALFLVLMAISSLGAPFVFGVVILRLISFIIYNKSSFGTSDNKKDLIVYIVEVALVIFAVFIQMFVLFTSERTSKTALDLFDRLWATFLHFIWFPYCNYYFVSIILTLVGVALWVVATIITKSKPLAVLYGAGFSFVWLFICSLSCDYKVMFQPIFDINNRNLESRFWTLSYMIAAFYVGCAVYKLWKRNKGFKVVAVILLIAEIGMLSWHYRLVTNGKEELYIRAFDSNIVMCDTNGEEKLYIPIGPFEEPEPFGIYVPTKMDGRALTDEDIQIINKEAFLDKPRHIGLTTANTGGDQIKAAFLKYDDLDYYVGCYRSGMLEDINGRRVERLEFMNTAKIRDKDAYQLYVLLESGKLVRVD